MDYFKTEKRFAEGSGVYKSFVEWNIRATNEYSDRSVLAFMYNRFIRPEEKKFLRGRGETSLWTTTCSRFLTYFSGFGGHVSETGDPSAYTYLLRECVRCWKRGLLTKFDRRRESGRTPDKSCTEYENCTVLNKERVRAD